MLLSDFFIRRPVFAIVVNALLALLGVYALSQLSVRELPQFEVPLATVTTSLPGASAEVVETEVTSRFEEAISAIDGVDYFTSVSAAGISTITITFKDKVDSHAAAAEVRAKVEAVRPQLPPATLAPVVTQLSIDAVPILYLSLSSPSRSAMELTELVETLLRTPLSTSEGVGSIVLLGARNYAMRIRMDPFKLAGYNITPDEVRAAVIRQAPQIPTGSVEQAGQKVNVVAETTLTSAEAFRRIVLRTSGNYLVRLEQVAEVRVDADEITNGILINGKPGLAIGVLRQSGANALAVSAEIQAKLPGLQAALPADTKLEIIFDSTVYIRQSVDEVFRTLRDAIGLVIIVVILFLGSLRASLVTIVTIPLSLIGTLAFMLVMGYSLNTFSLLAIILSVGLVVDDAIVDVENVQRHISRGLDPMTAAFVGSREIGFAVIATTLTLASVYLPIGFLPGLMGAMFREFAFTLAAAVILSGFISRTLSPMMCSRLLKAESGRPRWWTRRTPMEVVTDGYRRLLTAALGQRWVVYVLFVAVGVVAVAAARTLPSQLAPVEDQGYVFAPFTGEPSTAYSTLEEHGRRIAAVFEKVPEREGSLILLGSPDARSGFAILMLKPIETRERSAMEIGASILPDLKAIPGIDINVVDPGVLSGGGQLPVQIVVKSPGDYQSLAKLMERVLEAARAIPGIAGPTVDLQLVSPRLAVEIDRDLAGEVSVDVTSIANTVAAAVGDYRVSTFTYGTRNYNIIVDIDRRGAETQGGLQIVQVRDGKGAGIPLHRLVTIKHEVGADRLGHFDGQRSATLSAGLADGASLGPVLDELEAAIKPLLPAGATIAFNGPSRQLKEASPKAGLVFLLAFIFIFGFLAAQFESFRDPFIVLLVVPFSVLGSLLGLAAAGGSLNLYSGIGLITLVGLVAKQGILITEFANQLRDEGRSIAEAVIEASATRLRPILMTTVAMVVGSTPLIYSVGSGSNGRFQIGVVVIGGLLLGTFLSLFVVPVTYSLATRRERKPLARAPTEEEARRLLHGQFDRPLEPQA